MDEREFRRLLDIFPIVRLSSYCQAEEGSSSGASYQTETKTREIQNDNKTSTEGNFWQKLQMTAERKVGSDKAEKFVKAFRAAHETLVYKELSLEPAQSFLNSAGK
ncbi:hypothetical protein LUZ60_014106 [Juncus effusus]|nr:hypothetical protein LUZ60_014106 [Juncus effusus]